MRRSLPGELDGRRFLAAMARFGWTVARQTGSHRKLVHPGRVEGIYVAFHRTLGSNSVQRALRQAGIDESDFLKRL